MLLHKGVGMRGTLALPTGRLIVGDPSALFGDARPLDLELPPGDYAVSADAQGFGLVLGDGEPVRWADVGAAFDTPSGYVCLLDAAALEQFTDLGDEPVDEYELLVEQLRGDSGRRQVVEFAGLLVFSAGQHVRTVRAGYDRAGQVTRLAASY